MENNPILNGLITLAVGIILAVFKYKYEKISEKKEKIKFSKKESQRKIIERLKEVEFSLENSITSERPRYRQIQNDCLIFSNQITNILSQVIEDVPEEIIEELKRLNSELKDLGNFPLYQGYDLPRNCRSIIESTKEIIRKIENCSNN